MNEGLFKKSYTQYKNAVLKDLLRRGLNIKNLGHKFETYVRDFFVDKFDVSDCADVVYSAFRKELQAENLKKKEVKMNLDEAIAIAKRYGFKVVNESKMDEKYGEDSGTVLTHVIADFLRGGERGEPAPIEKIYIANGGNPNISFTKQDALNVVKAEFLSKVKELVGNGVSADKYNNIKATLSKQKSYLSALIYISGLMHSGEGRGVAAKKR